MAITLSNKTQQIEKAATNIFVIVAISSVVVSICLVLMNLLWSQSQFNSRVQNEKEQARNTLQENIEKSDELLSSLAAFENSGDIIPKQKGKTNSAVVLDALPSRYDFPALASSIQNIADASKVTLLSFEGKDNQASAEQTATDPKPEEMEFNASVEGTYSKIRKFISGLERSIRPIQVNKMELGGSDASLKLDFSATTYYQPAADLSVTTKEIQ